MDLFYRKEGTGSPLVIIHGLYGSSDNWINIGKRLGQNHTVYMVDLRNHGRSPFSQEHSFEHMKEDIYNFFEKAGLTEATILGHSMGGKVAMWFAAEYPERVNKLVIADIAPKNYLLSGETTQYQLHQNILQAMMEIDFTRIRTREDVDFALSQKIDNDRIRQFLLKNVEKEKHSRRYRWRVNVEVLYNNLEEIVSGVNYHWLEDRIPITRYPVIFIRGMKSNYILPEDEPVIREIYPDSRIVDIPDAGHWLHAEQPEQFTEAVMLCC